MNRTQRKGKMEDVRNGGEGEGRVFERQDSEGNHQLTVLVRRDTS